MNILLTGSTGFLGKRVLPLLAKHHRVTCFTGDLLKLKTLPQYDCIIHLAALVPKNKSEDTKELYEKNIRMTKNLLAARRARHLVFASTVEAFSPRTWYGKSKLACEKLCPDATILRFSVLYGAGDPIERAIPNFVTAAIKGSEIAVTGPHNKRDYLHVDDAARAMSCAVKYAAPGVFFIGTGHETTIRDAARAIAPDVKITEIAAPRYDLLFDTRPAQQMLKFKPKYIFPERTGELIPAPVVFDLDGTILDIKKKHAAVPRDLFSEVIEKPKYLALDTIHPGMKQILDALWGTYPLYLVTMRRNRKNLLTQITALRLNRYFPESRVLNPKDKIRAIAALKPGIVVGDTQLDIQAAKKAHAKSIAVTWGLRSRKLLAKEKPNSIVSNTKSLHAIIERIYDQQSHHRHTRIQ